MGCSNWSLVASCTQKARLKARANPDFLEGCCHTCMHCCEAEPSLFLLPLLLCTGGRLYGQNEMRLTPLREPWGLWCGALQDSSVGLKPCHSFFNNSVSSLFLRKLSPFLELLFYSWLYCTHSSIFAVNSSITRVGTNPRHLKGVQEGQLLPLPQSSYYNWPNSCHYPSYHCYPPYSPWLLHLRL